MPRIFSSAVNPKPQFIAPGGRSLSDVEVLEVYISIVKRLLTDIRQIFWSIARGGTIIRLPRTLEIVRCVSGGTSKPPVGCAATPKRRLADIPLIVPVACRLDPAGYVLKRKSEPRNHGDRDKQHEDDDAPF